MKTFTDIAEGITKPVPRNTIVSTVQKARKAIVGNELSPRQIAQAMGKALKTKFDIEATFRTVQLGQGMDQGDMNINAFYSWADDEDGDTAIELEFMFSAADKKLTIGKEGWEFLMNATVAALQHELLHQNQFRLRGFKHQKDFTKFSSEIPKVMKAQKYLGNDDEIEAFALNISRELVSFYGKDGALNKLRNIKSIKPNESVNMFAYLAAFGYDTKHTVIKKLLRKIVLFINKR